MAEPVRIQVRCTEDTERKYDEASGAFGMTYGEFAYYAAAFALENRSDFDRFVTKSERKREEPR